MKKFHVQELDYVPYYLIADPKSKVNLICYCGMLEEVYPMQLHD